MKTQSLLDIDVDDNEKARIPRLGTPTWTHTAASDAAFALSNVYKKE